VSGGPLALGPGARADVIDAVQTVFIVAAPIAALALVVVLLLEEVPLQESGGQPPPERDAESPPEQSSETETGAAHAQRVAAIQRPVAQRAEQR
jgi:hypothetical protein